jgi:hypothetical protein
MKPHLCHRFPGPALQCLSGLAKAHLEKSPRHQEWITVKHDQREVQSLLFIPKSDGHGGRGHP